MSFTLRASTVLSTQKSEQLSPGYPTGRKELGVNDTPSLRRDDGHDCGNLDIVYTKIKTNARFQLTLFRLLVAYAWECETSRGKTYQNGSVCHCGGCQAAHAALTPTLLDDKLGRIRDKIVASGFNVLDEHERVYMVNQFSLNTKDIKDLSKVKTREDRFDELQSTLTSLEKQGTFINTPVGMNRATTFENPTASNRIDCYLEHRLRGLEDQLATTCTAGANTPKQALAEFKDEYEKCLKELVENLGASLLKMSELTALWESMNEALSTTPLDLDDYIEKMDLFQESYDGFFEKQYGVPELEGLKKSLDNYNPTYWRIQLIKEENRKKAAAVFKTNRELFQVAPAGVDLFKAARVEIKLRMEEVAAQMSIVGLPYQQIHDMLKKEYGEYKNGKVITPTKEEAAAWLVKQVQPRIKQGSSARKKLKLANE